MNVALFGALVLIVVLVGVITGYRIGYADQTGCSVCRSNAIDSEADRADRGLYARWLL